MIRDGSDIQIFLFLFTTMARFVFLSFAAVLQLGLFSGSTSAATAFKPRTSLPPLEKALAIRGGAGPIKPELAAKILAGAVVVQAAAMILAPAATLEAYKFESNALRQAISRSYGGNLIQMGLPPALMLFMGMNVNESLGYTGLVWVATSILQVKIFKQAGIKMNAIVFGIAINAGKSVELRMCIFLMDNVTNESALFYSCCLCRFDKPELGSWVLQSASGLHYYERTFWSFCPGENHGSMGFGDR
jgi:hypothetical protein